MDKLVILYLLAEAVRICTRLFYIRKAYLGLPGWERARFLRSLRG